MADPVAPTNWTPMAYTARVQYPLGDLPARTTNSAQTGGFRAPEFDMQGMTFAEIAQTGLRQFAGYVREDFQLELVGRQGARTYNEMVKNSPMCSAIMYSLNATMRKVEWRVETPDDTPAAVEAADFVDSCRNDMSHTWEDLIAENLTMIQFGFAPHELVYKRRLGRNPGFDKQTGKKLPSSQYEDARIGWRKIPIRGQDTILKWFFGAGGEILGFTQQPYNAPIVDVPIEKALLFRPWQHKGNPEGLSVLRSAYRSYFLTKRLEEQEAILFERMSGVPVMKCPVDLFDRANAGDAKARASLAAFKAIVVNTRVNEQMGMLLPSDTYVGPTGPSAVPMYSFELVAPQGSRIGAGLDGAISRYNLNILTSVLADFILLGHGSGGRGSQALGVSKIDMFFQAVEGFTNSIAAVYNRFALPRLWLLNGMDYDIMPKITPDLAQRVDLDLLSSFILRMSQSGMPLFPDIDLENALRDYSGLPDITEDGAQRVLQEAMVAGSHGLDPEGKPLPNQNPFGQGDPNDPQNKDGKQPGGITKERIMLNAMVKRSINRRLMKERIIVNTRSARPAIRIKSRAA